MWQTGDPVAFQIWSNSKFKVKHSVKIQKTTKEINRDTPKPEKTTCKTFGTKRLQKASFDTFHSKYSKHCTLILLENLVEAKWLLVECHKKLLLDVLCMIPNIDLHQSNGNIAKSRPLNTLMYDNFCIIINETCYTFTLTNKQNLGEKYQTRRKQYKITDLRYIFYIISIKILYAFSNNLQYIFAYYKYDNTFILRKKNVNDASWAYFVSSNSPKNVIRGGNLFQCQNGEFISVLFLCDGKDDCQENSSEDEMYCQCNSTSQRTHKECKFIKNKNNRISCSLLYFEAKNGTCEKYTLYTIQLQQTDSVKFHHDNVHLIRFMIDEKLSLHGQFRCHIHQPNYYNFSQVCKYSLDLSNNLIPCSRGEHIQNCRKFTCNMSFKCPNFYCIPWSYVCDGKWDCPGGHDEAIDNHCTKRSCANMMKCIASSTCIHVRNICDDNIDCPNGDDEDLCSNNQIPCPSACSCLALAISCELGKSMANFFHGQMFEFYFIHLKNNTKAFTLTFLRLQCKYYVLFLQMNGLSHICGIIPVTQNTTLIDVGYNLITHISKSCFYNGFSLIVLNLNNNRIYYINKIAFLNLYSLKILNLSSNLLSTLDFNVYFLNMLNVENNRFHKTEMQSFKGSVIKILVTNMYKICCLLPHGTACTSKQIWYISCSTLLKSYYIKISFYSVSLIIMVINSMAIFIRIRVKTSIALGFASVQKCINLTNMAYSLLLIILWTNDLYYGQKFILKREEWTLGPFCHTVFFISLVFTILSASLECFCSFMKLMVTKYPLDSRFKEITYVKKCLLSITFCSLFITSSLLLIGMLLKIEFSISLCIPFADPSKSFFFFHILVLFNAVLHGVAIIFILFCNIKLIILVIKSKQKFSTTSGQRSTNGLILSLTIIICSTFVPWTTASVIYVSLSFTDKYPTIILYWVVVAVSSIPCVVNPSKFIHT